MIYAQYPTFVQIHQSVKLKKILKRTTRRNDADEFSKIFHDIIRYRIERDLINGDLEVKDLPARWNAECKELLGMELKSNYWRVSHLWSSNF